MLTVTVASLGDFLVGDPRTLFFLREDANPLIGATMFASNPHCQLPTGSKHGIVSSLAHTRWLKLVSTDRLTIW